MIVLAREPTQFGIVFVDSGETRKSVRAGLMASGIRQVCTPSTETDCLSLLRDFPDGLLILDWRGQLTTKILDASRGKNSVDLRKIFLIVEHPEGGFLQIMTDYSLNGIHAGPITEGDIQRNIGVILDPNSPINLNKEKFADIMRCKLNHDLDRAVKLIEEMVQASPSNNKLKLELASLHIEREEWSAAEKIVDAVLLRELNLPRALHLKARCLLQRKKLANAREYLRLSTDLNPFNADRLIDFGELLLKLYEPQLARQKFIDAQALSPHDPRAKAGMIKSSMLLGTHNDIMRLMADISNERERAALFNNAAILCVANGDFARAVALYDFGSNLLTSNSLKAKMIFNKSLSHMKAGERQLAIEICQEAMALDGNFSRAKGLLSKLEKVPASRPMGGTSAPELTSEEEELSIGDFSDMDEAF